jgi:hypothetical protein
LLGDAHQKTDIYGRLRWVYRIRIHIEPWIDSHHKPANNVYDAKTFFQPV